MKKKIILSVIAVILLAIVGTWYYVFIYMKNNRRDPSKEQGIALTANNVATEFVTNEDSANKKYNNKALEITGEVERVDTGANPLLFLKTGIPDNVISARLKAPQAVEVGKTITVKGIFTGYIMGDVQITEASVTNANATPVPLPATPVTPAKADTATVPTTQPVKADTVAKAVEVQSFKSSKGEVKFNSSTAVEDIDATNTQIISTLNAKGEIAVAALIKGFRFENELMQQHFNGKDYMNSEKFPKAEFKGTLENIAAINFTKDGQYPATAKGSLTIHGVSKPVTAKGTVTVKSGKPSIKSEFAIDPANYGIDSKDVSNNIKVNISVTY